MPSYWSTISFYSILSAFLLLFRNSLPFAWTIRTMLPYIRLRLRNFNRKGTDSNRLPSAHNSDPFKDEFVSNHRATIDECDFLGHLSNSSYPKNLDIARMKYSTGRLADFMLDGGWVPLGSTSFVFHNEIPILSKYTITSRIETWDEKWLYLRNEFHGKNKKGERILYCTSITKHCFKHGRKTIAPWFVMAYCGYSSTNEKESTSNSLRSKELRQSLLKHAKAINPLQAYQKSTLSRKEPIWCSPDQWDVNCWETERKERMDKVSNAFL